MKDLFDFLLINVCLNVENSAATKVFVCTQAITKLCKNTAKQKSATNGSRPKVNRFEAILNICYFSRFKRTTYFQRFLLL